MKVSWGHLRKEELLNKLNEVLERGTSDDLLAMQTIILLAILNEVYNED